LLRICLPSHGIEKSRTIPYEEDISGLRGLIRPKREVSATPNICSLALEGINPTFDPNRALFRRVFFLNEDRNKYDSVAFYTQQEYSALVEFGAAKFAHLRLTEQQFGTLTEHLPGLIQVLCADDYYNSVVHDNFWITTGGLYQTAWMHLGLGKNKKELLKLHELLYSNNILYLVSNQLGRYSGAMLDVINYSAVALAFSKFIEPQPHYSNQILYPKLKN
jgi:hypothetical protein